MSRNGYSNNVAVLYTVCGKSTLLLVIASKNIAKRVAMLKKPKK